MFNRIRSALMARRAAMLEAEALVYRFGVRGVEMAQTFARDPSVSEERREHYRRVARVAERRHLGIDGLDTATQYYEMARWQRRSGNLIGGGHPRYEANRLQAPPAVRTRPERAQHRNGRLRPGARGLRGLRQPSRRHRVGSTSGADTFTGSVTRVVDGDTFWISSPDVRIRVWGLDAPERDQPGGSQATAALSGLISGQKLTCRQRDIDRYGRIVGQCFLPDGRDITAA